VYLAALGTEYFNKRRTTMNYSKPEVNTLGEAKVVIEQIGSKLRTPLVEGVPPKGPKPAYDLDE
jgi:hypothetical protein